MREILFKAKTLTGEWVEGYLVKAKWYVDEKEICAIIPIDVCFFPHCEISEWYKVDVNTLCQYTGLTDKNGNKIWENDVTRDTDDDMTMVVRWDDEELRFVLDDYSLNGSIMDTYGFDDFCSPISKALEVIGNIFDNPELLKEGATDVQKD